MSSGSDESSMGSLSSDDDDDDKDEFDDDEGAALEPTGIEGGGDGDLSPLARRMLVPGARPTVRRCSLLFEFLFILVLTLTLTRTCSTHLRLPRRGRARAQSAPLWRLTWRRSGSRG